MYFDSVSQALGDGWAGIAGLAVSLAPRVDIGCGCCFNDVPSDKGVISDEDLALMSLVDGHQRASIGYPNISGAGLACFYRQDGLEWLNIAECNLCDDAYVALGGWCQFGTWTFRKTPSKART